MSNWLLVSDTHFTDSPNDEYRWQIFPTLERIAHEHEISEVVHLGDVTDRKDNHSRILVNKLIENFSHLQSFCQVNVLALAGNHDAPISGPYYWRFLDKLGIRYIQKPEIYNGVYLLPFCHNPQQEWAGINVSGCKAVFMHECVDGVVVGGGRVLRSDVTLDKVLPGIRIPVFSGDIHKPQECGGVFYIGAAHPVKFDEVWPNRVVVIKDDCFTNPIIIQVHSIRKAILDIHSSLELEQTVYSKNDQIRIRYHLASDKLTSWMDEQEAIRNWAKKREVTIASVEAVLIGDGIKQNTSVEAKQLELMRPEEVVESFASTEKLSHDILQMGKEIIRGIS